MTINHGDARIRRRGTAGRGRVRARQCSGRAHCSSSPRSVPSSPAAWRCISSFRSRGSLTLALAVPTGALLVRVFIVQHDCGHGSFFASRRANALVGRLCSLITLTPFANWGRQHSLHHADWNNLDRSGGGADIYSSCLTVRGLSRAVALAALALPPAAPSAGRQRAAAAAGLPAALSRAVRHAARLDPRALVGLSHQRRADLPVRHAGRCCWAGARCCWCTCRSWWWRRSWASGCSRCSIASRRRAGRSRATGASSTRRSRARHGSTCRGSLHWLTGNIGFHHVHHLNPHVPNYRLSDAHEAVHALHPVPPLTLGRGLAATFLTLWDERRGRLVRFRDAAA